MYVYHHEFEDAGRGLSPDTGILRTKKELRGFLDQVFAWLPNDVRKRQVEESIKDLDQFGTFEASMEHLAEELMDEGDVTWDQIESVDTDSVVRIREETKTLYSITYEFTDTDGSVETRTLDISANTKSEAKKLFIDAVMVGDEEIWDENIWTTKPEHAGGDEYYWEGLPERAGGLAPRPEKHVVIIDVEPVSSRRNPDTAAAKRRAMRG